MAFPSVRESFAETGGGVGFKPILPLGVGENGRMVPQGKLSTPKEAAHQPGAQ